MKVKIFVGATLIAFSLVSIPTIAEAHPGRTASDGCHNDRKAGNRHCHGSKSKRSAPKASYRSDGSVYYPNCTAARRAGKSNIRRGQPGYGKHLAAELFFKSDQWMYEKEWRIIEFFNRIQYYIDSDTKKPFASENGKTIVNPNAIDPAPLAMLKVPPLAIRSITLGSRLGEKEIRAFRNELHSAPNLEHVVLRTVQLNPDKYELTFLDY